VNQAVLDDAFDKAKSLRDDAVVKAAQIIADANTEAETIREQARQEGYNKGLEEGNMEAMKRADVYLENLQKEHEEQARVSAETMKQELAASEQSMVDISCSLIEKLTGILVDDYKPVLLHMINNALNEEETGGRFIIRVSDDNYSYVSDNRDRLSGAANPSITIDIFGDAKLDKNQCIIESDNGIIDLSMDVQVRNLITAIKLLS
jgi:flagellar assembly protein FliH